MGNLYSTFVFSSEQVQKSVPLHKISVYFQYQTLGCDLKVTLRFVNHFKTEQIIFTFQSFNASSYSGKENMFKNMADGVNGKPIKTTNQPAGPFNGSFGGILGWPAQLDKQPCGSGGASNADESNMEIITNYLKQ